ncbi:MAG: hypothetical protein JWL76_2132 [Thermoleophilia bacterium]|nr:hypothetical protein [Thermoleophilia bacterium]
MADTTVSTFNSLFPTAYEDTILVARAEMLLLNTAQVHTDRTGIEGRVFSKHAQVTAAAVAENADLAPTTFGKSSVATLTPGEIGAQVVLTDRSQRTDPNAYTNAIEELGGAMGSKIDIDLGAAFANFTGGSVGTAGGATPTTFRHLMAAEAILRANGYRGDLWAVLHVYQAFELKQSVSLEASMKNTPEVIRDELARSGYIGSIGRMHILESTSVPIATNDATGAVYTSRALGFDSRSPVELEPFRSPKGRKWELNMVGDYAAGVQYPAEGVKVIGKAITPA